MQLKLSLVLATLATLAAAAPQTFGPGPFAGQVQVCSGADFTGECTTLTIVNGGCVGLPFDIDSADPEDRWTCDLFTDDSCQDGDFHVSGSTPSLPDGGAQFNSVSCLFDQSG